MKQAASGNVVLQVMQEALLKVQAVAVWEESCIGMETGPG